MTNELGWLEKIVNVHWKRVPHTYISFFYGGYGPVEFSLVDPDRFPTTERLREAQDAVDVDHFWAEIKNGELIGIHNGSPDPKLQPGAQGFTFEFYLVAENITVGDGDDEIFEQNRDTYFKITDPNDDILRDELVHQGGTIWTYVATSEQLRWFGANS